MALTKIVDGQEVDLTPDEEDSLRAGWDVRQVAAAEDAKQQRIAAVRAEAQRRLISLAGARDEDHLDILLSNAALDAVELLDIGESEWSPEQRERVAQFRLLKQGLNDIRAASNVLEKKDPVPDDYMENRHWP